MWSSGSLGWARWASCSSAVANSCKDSPKHLGLVFSRLLYAAARCWSPKQSSKFSRFSSYVAPFCIPALHGSHQVYGFLLARSAVVLYYDLELVPEHGSGCSPSNLGGIAAPAVFPVPLLLSALASTSFNPGTRIGWPQLGPLLSASRPEHEAELPTFYLKSLKERHTRRPPGASKDRYGDQHLVTSCSNRPRHEPKAMVNPSRSLPPPSNK
jgi:hypothetical protein